jgi:hypothetical protein
VPTTLCALDIVSPFQLFKNSTKKLYYKFLICQINNSLKKAPHEKCFGFRKKERWLYNAQRVNQKNPRQA